jgi:hypothetical protein
MKRACLGVLIALPFMLGTVPVAADESPPPEITGDEALEEPPITPPTLIRFEEARLPPDLGVPPGNYVVTLVLTVDEEGDVSEVEPVASDDDRLTPLAAEAAKGFNFTPALYGEVPVAVQITYRYAFDITERERQVVFVFDVREKGLRDRLDGVAAILEENGRPYTSFAGRMEVSDIPTGTYTLYVPQGEFRELRRKFTVEEGKVGEADIYLERMIGASNQTIIRAPREARFVARQTLEATELRRIPGSGGDVLKMVENLPGIARSAFGSGALVVFGSPPFDTQVLIDDLPFVMLYHFGGLYSTVNPEFIQKIDFVPAGFDASYGRASGGIVNVTTKDDPLTGVHGAVDINLLHAGLVVGTPYSKDGDIQAAFRRSYIDGILELVDFGGDQSLKTAPRYYDYQLRLKHRFGTRNSLSIFINGSDDELVIVNKRANTQEPQFVGNVGLRMYSHSLALRWRTEASSTVRNTLALQASLTGFNFSLFGAIKYDLRTVPIILRDELEWRAHDKVTVRFGTEARAEPSWYSLKSPAPPRSGSVGAPLGSREIITTKGDFIQWSVSPWVSVEWSPLPWWTLVPSLRADIFLGDWEGWSIDPRLSNRFEVVKDTFFLKLAGGLYQQPPPSFSYLQDFGNPNLDPEAATHLLLGAEYVPIPGMTLSANGFYKWLFRRAEPTEDRTVRYTNDGKGRAYGADFLLRIAPGSPILGGRFFGWIAYTFTVSEIWDPMTRAYRSSDYEQTHLLNILASYELPRRWTIGGRFRLSSGFPYTPIEDALYDSDLDRHVGVPAARINSKRLPLFHQLDLRIDKEWVFNEWKFGIYLEVQNVYNQKNAEALIYNYDFSKVGYVSGTTILPVLGLKGEF